MDPGLTAKTAIITGGRGLVHEFAREGLNVVSASRDVKTGEVLTAEAQAAGVTGLRMGRQRCTGKQYLPWLDCA